MARYHILIVDDQRDVRLLLRTSLETLKLDLEIIDVPSAEEALLVLGKEQIDLMVVDIRLPGMSGLELHHRAGNRIPTTQLILITGLTDENIQRQIAEAGAAAYFYKPIQIGRFLEVVRNCLGIETAGDVNSQKSHATNLPLPVQPSLVRQFSEICTHQNALRGWILTAERNILCYWENSDRRPDSQIPEELMMGLLEQDRQQVQSVAGWAFPCHHIFSTQAGDLWITSLKPELVVAILIPKGTGVQKATVLLSEINKLPASTMTVDLEQSEPQINKETNRSAVDDEFDEKLSTLLGQASENGLQADDLAAFWDHLMEEDQAIQTGHGVMTYEEAVRMGLAKEG